MKEVYYIIFYEKNKGFKFLYGFYDIKKIIFENVLILIFLCCRKYLLKIC